MGNSYTVIFGEVRSEPAGPSNASLSGPPGGAWTQPCGAPKPRRRGRARAVEAAPEPKPVHDETFRGRGFERRVRTFVG